MADSPLNHSWPSFSKLWMKRWSFKRASECKPCTQPCGLLSVQQPSAPTETSPSSSLSPASIAEDVSFKGANGDQDTSSEVSDYDCPCEVSDSVEDLLGLSPSLRGSEYLKDLEEGIPSSQLTSIQESQSLTTVRPGHLVHLRPVRAPLATCSSPLGDAPPSCHVRRVEEPHKTLLLAEWPDYVSDNVASLVPPLDLTINLNGLLRMMEAPKGVPGSEEVKEERGVDLEGELEMDSFPILVRSMSTSRRHSWGIPVSPINLGRRLSLDTAAMDSDGEREDEEETLNSLFEGSQGAASSTCVLCPADEMDGLGPRAPRLASRPPHKAACAPATRLFSRSDILASDDCSRAAHISRVVDTSKQAARATGDLDLEENLQSTEGQSHIAKQRNSRSDGKESGNVTWYEFLSNENEDEEDRAEKVERGTKVRRKLSSLRNRMTGSFNKDKGKHRDKEQQREKAKEKARNRHHLVPGSFSSCATCSLCSKALQKKHGLQCMNCAVNVHKSCKSLLGECTSSTKKRDSPHRSSSSVSSYTALRDSFREREQWDPASSQALDGPPGSVPTPGMTIGQRGANAQPAATHLSVSALALNSGHSLCHHSNSGYLATEMDETDALRCRRYNEDAISLAPSTTESIIVEDAYYATLQAELDTDAQALEAESWSLAVEQQHIKKHTKEMVKRQDVIYELMQTEMHHVRTLKIMLHVYMRELRENLQLDSERLDCIFPRLESLLELHTHFLTRLKERQRESLLSPGDRNYTINTVADILIAQFSGEIGERMKASYGDFCSHHTEAVSCYKEQMQSNKKFHNVIRKINNSPIVRRLGVSECILLVTQRITKYPVLVERILSNTEAGTAEHDDLSRSLSLIKDTIVQVDALVNLHEKRCRLRDIHNKMEPKAQGKIKDGRVFRREDLVQGRRRLLHDGMVNWKAASGRLKDILAVLLSDVLLLLQEKDQRYVFAAVDNKPSVISLQKLIVREVAHEEKAMFLICASSNEPEMYKIHTNSKEERNSWMTHIRQAVESCPHTDERLFSEEEEEARAFRFKEFQERLSQKDTVIAQALTEKLQLFADLAESVIGPEDTASRSRLLLRGDAPDLQQGELLLKGAITDVENLQNLLQSRPSEEAPSSRLEDGSGSGALPRRAVTFGGYDSSPTVLNGSVKKNFSGEARTRDRSQRASSDPQLKDLCGSHTLEQTVDESCCSPARWNRIWSNSFPEAEFFASVLMLSQKLYSIQAVISQWDSHMELQRASLPGRHKGNVLLEQEKQRTLALQREELASFHKLQSQHRQEQQRWERERERHRQQVEATEARLRQREEECKRHEEHLAEERKELESQKETYQQDLERLRESTRAVEREKERLENQKKIKRKTIEVAPLSSSLNGELFSSSSSGLAASVSDLPLLQKPLARGSLSVAPADYAERPEVALRRETSSSGLPLKTEVPLHLFSTTNQLHKPVGLQQQIPTKLAAFSSSGKGKAGRTSKASHRTDSAASVDMRQMLPLKLSARDDASLKAKRSVSPHQQPQQQHSHPLHLFADQLAPPDSGGSNGPDAQKPPVVPPAPGHSSTAPPPHSHSSGSLQFQAHLQPPGPSVQLHGLSHSHSMPPPYKSHNEDLNKEDVIFF